MSRNGMFSVQVLIQNFQRSEKESKVVQSYFKYVEEAVTIETVFLQHWNDKHIESGLSV